MFFHGDKYLYLIDPIKHFNLDTALTAWVIRDLPIGHPASLYARLPYLSLIDLFDLVAFFNERVISVDDIFI